MTEAARSQACVNAEIPLLTETEASNSGKCETVVKDGDDSTVRNAEEEQPTGQNSAGSGEDAPVTVLWWKDRYDCVGTHHESENRGRFLFKGLGHAGELHGTV